MASGKPDYKDDVIISGKFGVTFIPVGVDAAGNMLGIMQGLGPGGLAPIALDAAGRMIANLGAQDIDRIVVTPTFGPVTVVSLLHNFGAMGTFDIVDITGKGTILGGYCVHETGAAHKICEVIVELDGDQMPFSDFVSLKNYNMVQESGLATRLIRYDETNAKYAVVFNQGMTFESSLKITLWEQIGASIFAGNLFYTLIP